MNLRCTTLSLALFSLTATSSFAASAPSNDFVLINKSGKAIGKASYTIEKKNGYKIRSHFNYRVDPADLPAVSDPSQSNSSMGRISDAQFSFEYSVDDNGNFLSGFTRDTATQLMTSLQPTKARDSININRMQAGVQEGVRTLNLPKPDFLVAPDYDPSVIQLLLTTALAHPHADNTYMLIVPASPDRGPMATNDADYVVLQPAGDAKGTLGGKPVDLKHYLLNFHVGKADLYTDADGNLMEADMDPLHAKYVRATFVLLQ